MLRRLFPLMLLAVLAIGSTGCVRSTTAKVALTPLTGVRDVVDAPVVSLANVFELWADRFDPWAPPNPNVSWTYRRGFDAGIGYSVGFFLFKGLSYVFGGVDYVVCRSLYPNYPRGISPWKEPEDSWWVLYFPNTRALWGDEPPDSIWDDERLEREQRSETDWDSFEDGQRQPQLE